MSKIWGLSKASTMEDFLYVRLRKYVMNMKLDIPGETDPWEWVHLLKTSVKQFSILEINLQILKGRPRFDPHVSF